MISAGRMRHRVTIQRRTLVKGSDGSTTEVWSDCSSRWAEIAPLRGRELFNAQQVRADVSHRITMRGPLTLSPDDRIVYCGRIFNIGSAIDVEERGREIEIHATEPVL
jgi:SPP1 family predicted phage head-tail adaptor